MDQKIQTQMLKHFIVELAKRAFKLKFTLAEDLEVLGASLKNGLLTIDMERVVP